MDDINLNKKLDDLIFNRLTIDEYKSQVKSGSLVCKPDLMDDQALEKANPNHPLAENSRFRRINAADYFHALSLEAPEKFDLQLLQEMHLACTDCCAAVRLAMVRTIGYLRNPISIPILEHVIEMEESNTWTREAAIQAVAIIKGDFASVLKAEYNWFENWMREMNSSYESWGIVKKYLDEKNRLQMSLGGHLLSNRIILLEEDELKGLVAVDQKSNNMVTLTPAEASQLQSMRKNEIGKKLQKVGVNLDPVKEHIQLESNHFLDEFPNSVLLDSTTLKNAEKCLQGKVTPVNLLDLSVLCTAIICYDRVLVQPFHCDLFAQYPALFSIIKYSPEAITGPLWTMCAELLDNHAPGSSNVTILEEAWRTMFEPVGNFV